MHSSRSTSTSGGGAIPTAAIAAGQRVHLPDFLPPSATVGIQPYGYDPSMFQQNGMYTMYFVVCFVNRVFYGMF